MRDYMRRLGLVVFGLAALSPALWGQSPNTAPVITTDASQVVAVRVGQVVSMSVTATDAEETGAGALTFSFAEATAYGVSGLSAQVSGTSGAAVSNGFTVPAAASGLTIEIGVTVSDGVGGEASVTFRYAVDGLPVIGTPSVSRAVEMTEGSFSVSVSDPEGTALSVQISVSGNSPLPTLSQTSFSGVTSGGSVSTSVKYVKGTYGNTYTFRVTVTDGAGSQAMREFPDTVSVRNLAPTVTLNILQSGNTTGDSSNPVKPGGVRVWVDIQDPEAAGYFPVIWEATKQQGSFCSGSLQFFGAEDWDASLIIPLVSATSTVRVKATVEDGLNSVVKTRDIVVAPEPGGCDPGSGGGGGGGGGSFPTVSASATPSPATVSQTITLTGSISASTAGYTPAWYLVPSTSGSNPVLLANSWSTTYKAPSFPTTLKFRFTVSDSTQSVDKNLTVTVSASSGGGGGGGQASCDTCNSGSPPIVDAGPASVEVIGGDAVTLTGTASDPNLPPTVIPSFTVHWEILNAPSGFNLESPTQFQTRLLTPVVQSDVTVSVRLTVTAGSNNCSCSDIVQVLVKGQSSLEPAARIKYAFAGSTLTLAAQNGTVMKDVASWPATISLQAVPSNFSSPVYQWTSDLAGAVFSAPTSAATTLTVPASSSSTVSARATVAVTEGGNPSVSAQSYVNFQIVGPEVTAPPAEVAFSIQPGLEAEVGTMVLLDGSAVSGVDGSSDGLSYQWLVRRNDGYEVPVMKYANRGIFFVPEGFGAGSKVTIQLVVSQGSASSDPLEKTLDIVLPTLRFAHFGVGRIPSTSQELKVELVLINDSSTSISGATLAFKDAGGVPVKLEVNGDATAITQKTFDLEAGAAGRFLLASPDGEVYSGWMEVTSSVKLTGLVLFRYLDYSSGKVRTETALYSSPLGRRFTMALGPGRNTDVGLAIANPGSEAVRFRIKVMDDQSGDSIEKELELAPGGQMAKFLPSLFGLFPIPEAFAGGTLTVEVTEASDANIIATVLRLRDGYVTTVPLAVRTE